MRCCDACSADACNRAKREGDRRGDAQMGNDGFPAAQFWNIGSPRGFNGFDRSASAHAIDEPDMRQPELCRQTFGLYPLAGNGSVRRATADGEVVAR